MTKKVYDETYINNIALALQDVLGTTDKFYVSQMADEVRAAGLMGDKIIDNSIVDLKTQVTIIKEYKFYNCADLETVSAPNVVEIEAAAFRNTPKMRTFYAPKLEKIGANGFYYASGLTSLDLPKCKWVGALGLAYLSNNGSGTGRISTINFSNGAIATGEYMTIGNEAFAENSGAIQTNFSTLRWLDVDNFHYAGEVDTAPTSTTTITVVDAILYGDSTPQTLDVVQGLIVSLSTTGRPYVFNGSNWVDYTPVSGADFGGNNIFHSTRIRDVGYKIHNAAGYNIVYKSNILFLVIDKNATGLPGSVKSSQIKGIFIETANGDLTDELPFTTLGDFFYQCPNLKYVNVPHLEAITDGTFRDTGLLNLNLPALVTFGRNSNYQGCCGSSDLETVVLGNGTAALDWLGYSHFSNCSSLYDLTINSTNIPSLPNTNQTMQSIFNGSPLYQFLGTTTTEIVEGATAGSVVIDGSTVSTSNGNIVSYGGEDWQRVNNKWQKWGNAQDKHPVIHVPNDLISSYQSHAKWGTLCSELWQAIT